jgi:hypothetical protein
MDKFKLIIKEELIHNFRECDGYDISNILKRVLYYDGTYSWWSKDFNQVNFLLIEADKKYEKQYQKCINE